MKFPKDRLGPILDGAIRDWHHPLEPGAPAPEGVHRIGRIGQIRILTTTLVRLDDVADDDARLAGYPAVGEYLHAWTNFYNLAWTNQTAWHINFQYEPPAERPLFLARSSVVGRPGKQNPSAPVTSDGKPNPADYTSSSQRAIDDVEAIHPAEIIPFTADARQRDEARKLEDAAAHAELPILVRYAMGQRDAKEHHVNISSEERVIERAVQRIERKTGRAA